MDSQDLLLQCADSCPANELEQLIAKTRRACRAHGVQADAFAANAADPDRLVVEAVAVTQPESETSAEAATDLPVVRQLDTIATGDGLHPKWWDGEPVDWDLCISVLAHEFECRQHQRPVADPAIAA